MKQTKKFGSLLIIVFALFFIFSTFMMATECNDKALSQILCYKGEKPGTGPGISTLKLTVGESVTITAKGVDDEGKNVPICPTWKADSELSLRPVLGKGRSIIIKALKPAIAAFVTATVITEDGKKVTCDIAVEVKETN